MGIQKLSETGTQRISPSFRQFQTPSALSSAPIAGPCDSLPAPRWLLELKF